METVGVWSGNAALLDRLRARLGHRFRFLGGCHPAELSDADPALLILSPTAVGLAGIGILRPRLALLPGENIALAHRVRARSAVSYGLGSRNTLTLSSLDGAAVALALQREVHTISGALVERQEWVLPFDPAHDTPEEFLCLAGALLLLDQKLG